MEEKFFCGELKKSNYDFQVKIKRISRGSEELFEYLTRKSRIVQRTVHTKFMACIRQLRITLNVITAHIRRANFQ